MWSIIGALAQVCDLPVTTAVTCPTVRTHPAPLASYAADGDTGAEIAHRIWANSGLPGELAQVLPSAKHFEQAADLVTTDMIRESTVCGPDASPHIEQAQTYAEAGFDEVYVANMGPHYKEMIRLWGDEVRPHLQASSSS